MWTYKVREAVSKWIVLEPVFFFFTFTLINSINKQNCYFEQIERISRISTNITDTSNVLVQQETSSLISYLSQLETGLSALVLLIFGPLSDIHGRKSFLLWNLFLIGIGNLGFVLFYILKDEFKIYLGTYIFFIISTVIGIGGGIYSFFMLAFSYVGDLSNEEPDTRMRRFSFGEIMAVGGIIAGSVTLGQVSHHFGDIWVFLISSVLIFLAFFYGLVRLRNIKPKSLASNPRTLKERILNMFLIPFKSRARNQRAMIILLALCFFLQESSYIVEDNLLPLYTRLLYNWDSSQLITYKAVYFTITALGQFTVLPILLKVN
ncbi:hippocampus abundant transcript 1 protein isoform X2 [Eurytemora carolleeae]|uniref:hippocampus abundant transcript 1 protein isoform X2 n=1 Tax=Eurytemora carolleeae TaxID=1294199 RepID=UPI000C789219|nr:hippocampus abundant transcript 1 protein isoform X2 [Eurytemora carolleeae]|eukprot:XP_023341850.1 hippocampus abundant transcript 1 protein-like isoform X2 [Eurytemora affinis]